MKALTDCRILLVDDTKANLDILVAGLRGEYKLNVALNGEHALKLAPRIKPDLILLDINMPGLDGYEVCRRLRTQPETTEVPIVFVSALDEVSNKARGFEVGANDYITKPFDLLEVKVRVRALLKAKAYNDAVKDQMAGELRVARDIQMGMLPRDLAHLQAQYDIRLAFHMAPAGEVGGDLLAAFSPNGERLILAMGDVSGKGIPAALFMVRTFSLLRLLARDLKRPEQILARLNDELVEDNPSSMFVTLACAVYEPQSRRLFLASGGQTRPVLLREGQPPRFLLEHLGTALGLEPGLTFPGAELTLQPTDTLLFYTDGVIEAFNTQGECYDSARMVEALHPLSREYPETITRKLLEHVREFAGEARQSDDIALLVLRVESTTRPVIDSMESFNFAATPAGVIGAVEALRTFAAAHRVGANDLFALSLALEECASNIVHHAYSDDPERQFQVRCQCIAGELQLTLQDTGIPFDMRHWDAAAERDPDDAGGWGLHLARNFLDDFSYTRAGDQNVWRLLKRLEPVPLS